MNNILFIIGNGFDLAHGLPTKFDPDFKVIAEKNESNPYFWELYQSAEPNICSDFENLILWQKYLKNTPLIIHLIEKVTVME